MMRLVRKRILIDHFVEIKLEKLFRMARIKRMAEHLLGRIRVFSFIQSVIASKVRNMAFGRNARTAKENNVV